MIDPLTPNELPLSQDEEVPPQTAIGGFPDPAGGFEKIGGGKTSPEPPQTTKTPDDLIPQEIVCVAPAAPQPQETISLPPAGPKRNGRPPTWLKEQRKREQIAAAAASGNIKRYNKRRQEIRAMQRPENPVWEKGMPSPNRGGRPPENPVRHFLKLFLENTDPDDPDSAKRVYVMTENLYRISCGAGRDAVNAWKALIEYGYGRAAPSGEELKALEDGGMKVVILPVLPVKEARVDKPRLPAKFDSEIIDVEYDD